MAEFPIGKPKVSYGIARYAFDWEDINLTVVADRITEDGKTELYFYYDNGDGKKLLHMGTANLLSSTMQREFIKALSTRGLDCDWQTVLTYVARDTMEHIRLGEPVEIIAGVPKHTKLQYTVRPILEKELPTTIYGPGASAKSYLADLLAIIVQFNHELELLHTVWKPEPGNVLYLDWESNQADHERRIWALKQGLGLSDGDAHHFIYYRKCSQPLVSDLFNIQRIVHDFEISLVIVDSQMAASGYGIDAAQLASHYYNALNSLKCTTLTIDHMSKEEWKGMTNAVAPYGSVVKYNRCRSLYEVQKKQYPGENYLEIALVHRKHNEGLLQTPTGIRFNFYQDYEESDKLTKVDVEWTDPEDVMKQKDQGEPRGVKLVDRISGCLFEKGQPLTIDEIVGIIQTPDEPVNKGSVKSILYREKGMFKNENSKWSICIPNEN